MPRLVLVGLLLTTACGVSSTDASPPNPAEVSTTAATSSTTVTSLATTSTIAHPDVFPECERLPTQFELIEVVISPDDPSQTPTYPDGTPVVFFDLANMAGVETYKIRSGPATPMIGQYRDGLIHYVVVGEESMEWVIGPGMDAWARWEDEWYEEELGTWFYADPAVVYLGSLSAIEEMDLDHWDTVEGHPVAVFTGGPEAYVAYFAHEAGQDHTGTTVEIWMSPDCYPMKVHIEATATNSADVQWEIFDLDEPVDFDVPPALEED